MPMRRLQLRKPSARTPMRSMPRACCGSNVAHVAMDVAGCAMARPHGLCALASVLWCVQLF